MLWLHAGHAMKANTCWTCHARWLPLAFFLSNVTLCQIGLALICCGPSPGHQFQGQIVQVGFTGFSYGALHSLWHLSGRTGMIGKAQLSVLSQSFQSVHSIDGKNAWLFSISSGSTWSFGPTQTKLPLHSISLWLSMAFKKAWDGTVSLGPLARQNSDMATFVFRYVNGPAMVG